MAPNKKKKKIASNPARGFATTSLPSKSKEARSNEDTEELCDAVIVSKNEHQMNAADTNNGFINQNGSTKDQHGSINQMSPEELEAHLEDAELQNFVDTHANRVKADALRQVNRLESERRQMRSHSNRLATASWLSDDAMDNVLNMYKTRVEQQAQKSSASHNTFDETSILTRLWTLERVLQALKFPNIDPALEYILSLSLYGKIESSQDYIWGLQESLRWYAAERRSEDLPDYESGTILSLEEALKDLEIDSDSRKFVSISIHGDSR